MTVIERLALTLGSIKISYLAAGPSDESSEVIFLLHDGAYGSDAELAWAQAIPTLSRRYRVIAPDLLGYGQSDKVAYFDRTVHSAQTDLVAAICTALGLNDRRVHFVGTSFGGGLVVSAAARQPSVWPMASGVSIGGTSGYARHRAVFAQLQDYDQSMEDARRITGLLVAADLDTLTEHVVRRHSNGMLPGHWETLCAPRVHSPAAVAAASGASRPSPLDFLSNCDVPLLFVEGREDRLLESGWARRLAAVAPNGEATEIEGAHCPNIDNPTEVTAAILRFVGRRTENP